MDAFFGLIAGVMAFSIGAIVLFVIVEIPLCVFGGLFEGLCQLPGQHRTTWRDRKAYRERKWLQAEAIAKLDATYLERYGPPPYYWPYYDQDREAIIGEIDRVVNAKYYGKMPNRP